MKQIIFITLLFLFISCGKENHKDSTKTPTDFSKETKTNEDDAPVVALAFINAYIADSNKMNESVGYVAFVNSSEVTTNEFKTELKRIVDDANKNDPEMGLDIDPLIPGNDYPDEGFELESFDKETNLIVVKGKNWADFKVTIKMVLADNKWLIDGCGIVNIPESKQ